MRNHSVHSILRVFLVLLALFPDAICAMEPLLATRGSQGSTTGVHANVPGRRSLSVDGRYALIQTSAINLVPNLIDRNAANDLFLIDSATDAATLISSQLGDTTRTASGPSGSATMSPDGQWVLFNSDAKDIVPGVTDTNGATDVFLFNRLTRHVQLVSRASGTATGNGGSVFRGLSDDGRYALFVSFATDLSNHADSNSLEDLFLFDANSGSVRLISAAAGQSLQTGNGGVGFASLSGDARVIAFDSTASDLLAGLTDTNNASDVFVYALQTQALQLLSHNSASTTLAANASSVNPMLAPDGSSVLFASQATDLITGLTDNNATLDVFRWNSVNNTSELVSGASGGTSSTSNTLSFPAQACSDPRFSLFRSSSSNLVPDQIDSMADNDYFLRDHLTQSTSLVTHVPGQPNAAITDGAGFGGASPDCRYILFTSTGTDVVAGLTDPNAAPDLFYFDRQTDSTLLVSNRFNNPLATSIDTTTTIGYGVSSDGVSVLYVSSGSDLLAGPDFNPNRDVFLRNMSNGVQRALSRPARPVANGLNGTSLFFGMSRDGNWLLYGTAATNVVGSTDPSDFRDFYLFGVDGQSTTLVSRRFGQRNLAVDGSGLAALSGNGRYVAFSSTSTEVLHGISDTNEATDIYLFDRELETTTLVSKQFGMAGTTANDASIPKFVGDDGSVLFASEATNLVAGQIDSSNTLDLFLYQPGAGVNVLVSHNAGQNHVAQSTVSNALGISANGRYSLYSSSSSTVVLGISDTNNVTDLFLFDANDQSISLISRTAGQATTANDVTDSGRISADGEWIVLVTKATNLIAGSTGPNLFSNVVLHRRSTGDRWLVSHANTGPLVRSDGGSVDAHVSANGEYVAFQSSSRNLVPGITHTDSIPDAFLFERATGTIRLLSAAWQTAPITSANNTSRPFGISDDGMKVGIGSQASNLVAPGTRNFSEDAFVYDVPNQMISLVSRHVGRGPTDEAEFDQAMPHALSADGESIAVGSISAPLCADCNVSNIYNNFFLYREQSNLLIDSFE